MKYTIVDTGPLYAAVDTSDRNHKRCLEVLQKRNRRLVIPALVIAEASYLIEKRLGSAIESRFLAGLSEEQIEGPSRVDLIRMGELVAEYEDFPLGGTDASIVALAERLNSDTIATLDHRHFSAVRPTHCAALTLVP